MNSNDESIWEILHNQQLTPRLSAFFEHKILFDIFKVSYKYPPMYPSNKDELNLSKRNCVADLYDKK